MSRESRDMGLAILVMVGMLGIIVSLQDIKEVLGEILQALSR